jgi:putative hydrolase of the HAD superfamily
VPHGLTWELEHAAAPEGHPRFREIDTLGRVIDLVAEINS